MPIFDIEQYELVVQKHRVVADTPAQAIKILIDGGGERVGEPEYLETADDYGQNLDNLCDGFFLTPDADKFVAELHDLDLLNRYGDIIPSIRGFKEVNPTLIQKQ